MKRARAIGDGCDAVLLWLACAVALGAGAYVAFVLLGSAVDTERVLTGRVAEVTLADAALLVQRPRLEAQRERLERRLSDLDLTADRPTSVARFIRSTARIAQAHGVSLESVDERSPDRGGLAATPARAGADAFEPILLDVALSGAYRDIIASIRTLADAPSVTHIEIAAVERNAAAPAAGAALTARLHIALQRLAAHPSPPTP